MLCVNSDGHLLKLALVIFIGDHESQGQVTLYPPSSFTQQRMLRLTDCGLHTCRHTEGGGNRKRYRMKDVTQDKVQGQYSEKRK